MTTTGPPPALPTEPGTIAARIGGLRQAVRRIVAGHPMVYLPIARWRDPEAVLEADTALVIDGYQRSANTFAVVAFQVAQNDHVRVAHHVHAAAHLVAAAQRGVPALFLVREPEEAILSSLVREPFVTPEQSLRSYAAFYERVLPCRSGFVVATFPEVTENLGLVIRRVNERFGTRFAAFEHTQANMEVVFALIEERARRPPWEKHLGHFLSGRMSLDKYRAVTDPLRAAAAEELRGVPENRVSRPSEERRAVKAMLRDRYLAPELAKLRHRAERAYRAFA